MGTWRFPANMNSVPDPDLRPDSQRSISKDDVNALPIARYEGEVNLVADASSLERALADLRGERVIGFDTETRPAFKPGESYLPSLVQLATARAVHIFQVQQQDFAAALAEVFAAAGLLKVGVSVADDLLNLKRLFAFEHRSVLDLGHIAKRRGMKQSGVRNLSAIFLGLRIPKGQKTSNWAARSLSAAQLNYAATDAWACRQLYLRFGELDMLRDTPAENEVPDDESATRTPAPR